MLRKNALTPWLIGLLLATLLMGSLALFADMQYTGNDDTPLLRSSMGYEGGEPATFHLHTHAAFSWLLFGLAKLFPGVAWFSILQLFLLWLSQVVIVKSLCRLALRGGLPLWTGAAVGALFLLGFALYISCRITYTVTAALCGAAAVAQLQDTEFTASRKAVWLGILGSGLLLLACYYLRMSAVLPAACFWLLLFALKGIPAKRRHALLALLTVAILFALSVGGLLLNISLQGAAADTRWHDQRIQLFDYTGFSQEVPDETLAEIGWSRDELALVENWFFLNDNITGQAFQTLIDQQTAAKPALSFGERIAAAWDTVRGVLTDDALRYSLLALLGIALAALLRGGLKTLLPVLLSLLGGLVLLTALAYMGRLNSRAAQAVLLPMAAAVFTALAGAGGIPKQRWLAAIVAVPLAVSVVSTGFAAAAQINASYIPPNPYFTDTTSDLHADLDEIALMNEDRLIIYDLSLSHDHRLFPDTTEGIPRNVMLWGGWQAHTPSWRRQLLAQGISDLSPALFLRDTVLYASTYDQPPAALLSYISQATDLTVDWYYYDQWGYVNLFEFDAY